MNARFLICAATVVLAGTAPAFSQEPASRWDHNGSEVGLFPSGNDRVFRYTKPRVGLEEVGVTPGTVLFVGRRSADTYSGQAYVFSTRCGPQAYFVSGTVSEDQRTVTLQGDVPLRYDALCRATASRPDTLVFTFIEPPEPPPGLASGPPSTAPAIPNAAPSAPAPPYSSKGAVDDASGSDRTAEKVLN